MAAKNAESALQELLQKAHEEFHIEYSGYLANHLPHNLVSLYKMGATAPMLEEYYNKSAKDTGYGSLEPRIKSTGFINKGNWTTYIGTRSYFDDYSEFFLKEIELKGIKETVSEYVPVLAHRIAGGALHPLIHLGFGLEVSSVATVADGLAYLCHVKFDFPDKEFPISSQSLSPTEVLINLRNDHTLGNILKSRDGFQTRMEALLNKHGDLMLEHASKFVIRDWKESMDTIMRACIQVFAFTGCKGFFLLHGVTSAHALKFVLPYLAQDADRIRLLKFFWLTVCYVYVCTGRKEIIPVTVDEEKLPSNSTWEKMKEEGLNSMDEHIPKIVHALEVVYKEMPDMGAICRWCARKTLDLIETPHHWDF